MKTITSYRTVYVSDSGKTFLTEEECRNYELNESAETKIKRLRVDLSTNGAERDYWKKKYGEYESRLLDLKREFKKRVLTKESMLNLRNFETEILAHVHRLKAAFDAAAIAEDHLKDHRDKQRKMRRLLDTLSNPRTRRERIKRENRTAAQNPLSC